MEAEGYDSDELELLEQYELAHSDSESSDEGFDHFASKNASAETDDEPEELDDAERLEQLRAPILGICSALGGYEEVLNQDGNLESVYRLGDDCLGCLRDLRRLWRQDDTDPSRAVARVFAQVNLVHNDLVPILLHTAGKGDQANKIALACTDLITAVTWPIDMMAELRDAVTKDEDPTSVGNLASLERAQVQYKSSILRLRSSGDGPEQETRDVLTCVMRHLLLPSLSKPWSQRGERDVGVISLCMHLFRNLLAIKDPVATSLSSADVLANANLQSLLVVGMEKAHVLDTILMLSSSAESREFNPWNAVTMECVYHIFVGSNPKTVADLSLHGPGPASSSKTVGAAQAPPESAYKSALSASLAAEAAQKRASIQATGSSRHSRFGTTINFTGSDGVKRVARSQAALRKSVEQLQEETLARMKRRARNRKKVQEKGAPGIKGTWTTEARSVLREWADRFVKDGFETMSRSVLKDIRSEREKLGDLGVARVRIMQLAAFFLEYFLLRRASHSSSAAAATAHVATNTKIAKPTYPKEATGRGESSDPGSLVEEDGDADQWPFSLVGEWLEAWAFKMVLVRTLDSQENKAWLEFVTSVQLWTVLLRLIDSMSRDGNAKERDAADGLQAQLYYMSETLETCVKVGRAYVNQSFTCLDAIISFAYVMPKMLERYASQNEHMYVKARRQVRKSREEGEGGEMSIAEADSRARERMKEISAERTFEFQAFQRKMCTGQLAKACVNYLGRWSEYSEPQVQLSRVVGVMHRICIKAGNAKEFFPAKFRSVFRNTLSGPTFTAMELCAPSTARDLKKLIEHIQRKFSKLDSEQQTIYEKDQAPPKPAKAPKVPSEIRVKDGRSHEEELGIAVGLLLEKEKMAAVFWVKSALEMASAQRSEIILRSHRVSQPAEVEDQAGNKGASNEVSSDHAETERNSDPMESFTPYDLLYEGKDELRLDASTLPELKLLCRTVGLESNQDDVLNWRWTVPTRLLPEHLDADIAGIEHFIREPFDANGEKLSSLVQRVRKPRSDKIDPAVSGLDASFNALVDSSDDESDSDFGSVRKERDARGEGEGRKGKKVRQPGGAAGKSRTHAPRGRVLKEFIEDSDEEFAFAMQEVNSEERSRLSMPTAASQGAKNHLGNDSSEVATSDESESDRPSQRVTSEEEYSAAGRRDLLLRRLRASRTLQGSSFSFGRGEIPRVDSRETTPPTSSSSPETGKDDHESKGLTRRGVRASRRGGGGRTSLFLGDGDESGSENEAAMEVERSSSPHFSDSIVSQARKRRQSVKRDSSEDEEDHTRKDDDEEDDVGRQTRSKRPRAAALLESDDDEV
ncbi:hypothetical protein IE53DRAFT_343962 [Violaceomyces palustris]|uniref:Uncharacterized protein n=1 Tax=Violaceomyces palustris TaxID=1673888 RepID=A0ACD0NXP0_9BASI|nr:hypothetical protein IE53DRAFT_343962 [Violaceomyces palustris]